MPEEKIVICDSAEDLNAKAARLWVETTENALRTTGRCTVALSGGSTPRSLYELLGSRDWAHKTDWSKLELFWGDERCVPPDHAESNYGMVKKALLSRVPVPEKNVFRVPTEAGTPEQVAAAYEKTLKQAFGAAAVAVPPQFDLMLLGLGGDGHTASLFPFSPILKESKLLVAATYVESMKSHRVTLTLPVINHSKNIVFLVSGESKAEVLRQVLRGDVDREKLPSQSVHPDSGSLTWMVDKDAARLI